MPEILRGAVHGPHHYPTSAAHAPPRPLRVQAPRRRITGDPSLMADQSKPKSCSSQTGAGRAEAEPVAARAVGWSSAWRRRRFASGTITSTRCNAARRRKHPDKQERLIFELRAEIAALKRRRCACAIRTVCAIRRDAAPDGAIVIAPSDFADAKPAGWRRVQRAGSSACGQPDRRSRRSRRRWRRR